MSRGSGSLKTFKLKTIISANKFRKSIQEDFPKDKSNIFRLCINGMGLPVGYSHIDILLDSLNVKINKVLTEELRVGYIYLSGYYFLLDSIIDEHIENKEDCLYLTHLLSAAIYRFSKYVYLNYPTKSDKYINLLLTKISENAAAIKEEITYKSKPLQPKERDEFNNIIGRANSTFFLFELISITSNKVISDKLKNIIYEFVYYMQLGDDLGDWRIDFKRKHWTSFLRVCFRKLGKIPKSLVTLEDFVYSSGIYEERSVNILKGFDKLLEQIDKKYPKLRRFVLEQRNRLYNVLLEFIQTKLPYVKKQDAK